MPAPSPRISHQYARSWLLVSGAAPAAFESARADVVILDLEDAVAAAAKDRARTFVMQRLRTGRSRAWVRINDTTSEFWSDDLAALGDLVGLDGVVLAKTEHAEQVHATAARIPAGLPLIPLIESAVGVENAMEIGRHPATSRLAFGSGDFRRDTGMHDDVVAMAYPRSRLTVVSRACGLPGPIDGPTRSRDHEILLRQTAEAAALGMTGRLCLRSDQVPTVDTCLSPSQDEISWAREAISRSDAISDPSDVPRLAEARKVVELAEIFA